MLHKHTISQLLACKASIKCQSIDYEMLDSIFRLKHQVKKENI